MNFELSPEDQEFFDSFRSFCRKEIAPVAAEYDEAGALPREHYRKLARVGYTGLLHDPAYGGQGAGWLTATLAQIALAESCGATFFSVGASGGLFGLPIAAHGTEAQKRAFLPPIISGDAIGCLAVTEPGAGSDVNALTARARRDGDAWVLTGQKTYITNAPNADFALVLARLETEDGRDAGLTHLIVDLNSPGVSRGQPMKKMGLCASPTGELFFDDVRVPDANVLGGPGQGFRITMEAFNKERLAIGAYSVGVMAACFEDARAYAKTRKAFGRPIIKHQSVAFMLADIWTRYEAARWLLLETAWLFDRYYAPENETAPAGRPVDERPEAGVAVAARRNVRRRPLVHNGQTVDPGARAAEVKLLASGYARECANLAVQIHGGAGYMEEYRVARMYRDVKLAEIGGGSSEIQKQIIARSEYKRVQ